MKPFLPGVPVVVLFPSRFVDLIVVIHTDNALLKVKVLINKSCTNRHTRKHGGQVEEGK